MTRSKADRDKFVELRASGMTLAQTAQELNIAYNTAVAWERQDKEQIEAAKAIQIEELMDEFSMTKDRRLEIFGQQLLDMQAELDNRDLSKVETPELVDMMVRLSELLKSEAVDPKFMAERDIEQARRLRLEFESVAWFGEITPKLQSKFIRLKLKEIDEGVRRLRLEIKNFENK